jgi:hypothetical protein
MKQLRTLAFVALVAAALFAGNAKVAATGDYGSFVSACQQQGGWVEEWGICGGGFITHDCTACNLWIGLTGACSDYCCSFVDQNYCDGPTGVCVCMACTEYEYEACTS